MRLPEGHEIKKTPTRTLNIILNSNLFLEGLRDGSGRVQEGSGGSLESPGVGWRVSFRKLVPLFNVMEQFHLFLLIVFLVF